jgi:WD40 repeat protein
MGWVAMRSVGIALVLAACGDGASSDVLDAWPADLDIAFVDDEDDETIWLADADEMEDSASAHRIDGPTKHLAWSPCGDEMAALTRGDGLIGLSVGSTRDLADLHESFSSNDGRRGIWWTASGTSIAVLGGLYVGVGVIPSCGYGEGLFVCDVSSMVCRNAVGHEFRGPASPSPLDDRIAVVRRTVECSSEAADGTTIGSWEVVVHDAAAGGQVEMPTSHGEPTFVSWSPTGDRIAVAVERDGGVALLVWRPDTGSVDTVIDDSPFTLTAWFPDGGRWLVASATDPQRSAIIDATTGDEIEVISGYSEIVLAPDGVHAIAFDRASSQRVVLDLATRSTRPAAGDRHWWRPRCDSR